MSTLLSSSPAGVDAPSDAELISAVRGGESDAYGELFERHVGAARRLARQLVTGPDADDLVSEAFAKVLVLLQHGGGPDLSFRAYLLTAVRRLHVDRLRAAARLQTTADLTPFDPGVPFRDTAVEGFENDTAARAFASLPERWQLVLWHTEVEGQRPAEVAPLLGMTPNSVSALAYRAREGLRQAYLSEHAQDTADARCAWTHDHLGAYVRGGLSRRDAARVEEHVGGCHRCAAVWLELDDLNAGLAGLLAPLLLGAAAVGYLGSGVTAAGATGIAGVAGGVAGRLRDLAASHASATAATGLALGAAVVSGILLWPGHEVAPAPAAPAESLPMASADRPHPPHHVRSTRLHAAHHASAPQPAAGTRESAASPSAVRAPAPDPAPSPSSSSAPTPAREPEPGSGQEPFDGPTGTPDVDLEVRLDGLPPGGSTTVGAGAETGLLDRHPVRRRIVVGASG